MATSTGNQLAQNIRQRLEELKKIYQGLDESTASRKPVGRRIECVIPVIFRPGFNLPFNCLDLLYRIESNHIFR
jgi:hypothetical protein